MKTCAIRFAQHQSDTLPCASPADEIVERITPFSLALGRAAKCDSWAVEVFAEEVVRGGPAFAVSLLISNIEPALRAAAELGAWQVSMGYSICITAAASSCQSQLHPFHVQTCSRFDTRTAHAHGARTSTCKSSVRPRLNLQALTPDLHPTPMLLFPRSSAHRP